METKEQMLARHAKELREFKEHRNELQDELKLKIIQLISAQTTFLMSISEQRHDYSVTECVFKGLDGEVKVSFIQK